MKTRKLGESLSVSSLGFGCMGLSHAYGVATPKEDAVKKIQAAYEQGYTYFDTAEIYVGKYADGSNALNEEVVGAAIQPIRNQVVVATKCGLKWEGNDLVSDARPESIRKSIEGSLKRMNLDVIDLYYLHREDPNVEPEVMAEAMAQLIKEGKIRYFGISNASEDYIRRADEVCKVSAVQARYSPMSRQSEKLFSMLEERNIGLVAYSPLANGFLTSGVKKTTGNYNAELDFRNNMPQYTEEGMKKGQGAIDLITELAKEKNATPAQISLAWMLCKKPWIVPIPGTSKRERMIENAGAADVSLNQEEIAKIDNELDTMDFAVFGN